MRLFIIYLNISVCFGHANMQKLTIYYMEPKTWVIIGGKAIFRNVPYNVLSLTTR